MNIFKKDIKDLVFLKKSTSFPDWRQRVAGLEDTAKLKELTEILFKLITLEPTGANYDYKTLIEIDEAHHAALLDIMVRYGKMQFIQPNLESQIYDACYYYLRSLYKNYEFFIDHYVVVCETSGDDEIPPQEVLLARAIKYCFAMKKLRYFIKLAAPELMWSQVFNLYKFAERLGVTQTPVRLYPKQKLATIDGIFIHGCMLETLYLANFSRQEIELASTLTEYLIGKPNIETEYMEDVFIYYVDINSQKGTRRARHFQPGESCRYWQTEILSTNLSILLDALSSKKEIKSSTLKDVLGDPLLFKVVEKLNTEWSRKSYQRQRRREARNKIQKSGSIEHGYENVCQQIKFLSNHLEAKGRQLANANETFEERVAKHSVNRNAPTVLFYDLGGEAITIEDESTLGCGLLINAYTDKWAEVDTLVSVSLHENKEVLLLGIVRTIKQPKLNQCYLGISKLSNKAIACQAKRADQQPSAENRMNLAFSELLMGFTMLFLPAEEALCSQERVLMPRIEYSQNVPYEVNMGGKRTTISISELIEAKSEWVLAHYKVLA